MILRILFHVPFFFFFIQRQDFCVALTVLETYFEGHGGLCCAPLCPAQIFAFFFFRDLPLFSLPCLFLSFALLPVPFLCSQESLPRSFGSFSTGDFLASASQVLDDSIFCYFYFQEIRVLRIVDMSSFSDL